MKCSIWKISHNEWGRHCPMCDKIVIHKGINSKYIVKNYSEKNVLCKSCSIKGRKHTEKWKVSMSKRMNGKKHPLYGTHPSKNTIKKLSLSHKGKIGYWRGKSLTQEAKEKLSLKNIGKRLSEETKEKIRIARLNQIRKLGGGPTYNKRACDFIDNLNIIYNLNLQHALNGGEQMIAGYHVDGYDKTKNIIFEYDEPHHHWNYKKDKDMVRQQRIINKVNPSLFIRYDEKNNRLYNSLTNNETKDI